MDIEISVVSATPAARVGVVYSTKNRCDLSAQTAPCALSEPGCDGFWLDGSDTPEGRGLPSSLAGRLPALREIHRGVDGGPDRAIVYGLSYLLARGYDYLALVENDVLLAPGWLPGAMSAMERAAADGLRVGAATVRTFDRRIMFVRPGYAVMFNIGAGMIVLTREAAEAVLATYRTTSGREISRVCRKMTEGDVSRSWDRGMAEANLYGADWFFDCALMQMGFASVGALPALARNIDTDLAASLGIRPVAQAQPAAGLDPALFRIYQRNLRWAAQTKDAVGYCFDPPLDRFVVFPHQLPPPSYGGDWRPHWRQSFGPFELQAANTGGALRWDLVSGCCEVIFRTSDETRQCRVSSGGRAIEAEVAERRAGNSVLRVSAVSREPRPIEVEADAGVTVNAILFTDPQPWFCGLADWRERMERLGIIARAAAPALVPDGS